MNFVTAVHTDVGIRKKTNQDSSLVLQAQSDYGTVLFAVLCDGMGGLAKGEVASSSTISAFREWFCKDFPKMLYEGMDPEVLRTSWEQLARELNRRIMAYAVSHQVGGVGTTCVALLIVGSTYYIMNIGDSRAYRISDNLYLLTKDQTLVQRELDSGRITYEESLVDPRRNILLQCIGAVDVVRPDFYTGDVKENECYMLCSDGFRHEILPEELYRYMNPAALTEKKQMQESLAYLVELNKQRGETDNISVLLIRTY